MRMWMIDPKLMCGKHLAGEHNEIHMLFSVMLKQRSIDGFLEKRLLEPHNIKRRHDALANELNRRAIMKGRKPSHKTPIRQDMLNDIYRLPVCFVDIEQSKLDLFDRCEKCRRMLVEDDSSIMKKHFERRKEK